MHILWLVASSIARSSLGKKVSDSRSLQPLYLFSSVRVQKLYILGEWSFRIIGSGDAPLHFHNIPLLKDPLSYEFAY
jgi:hypothetical protein